MENNTEINKELALLEKQVEQQLAFCIQDFQLLSELQLNHKDAAESWSVAQCLWHVNSYGNFYLPRIEQAVQTPKTANKAYQSGWLGSYFAKIMHPETTQTKYKAFKNHRPPNVVNGREELAEFIHQQEMLLLCIRKAHKADLNQRLPISIAPFIRLKLGDVFQFMVAHIERHMQQAQRINYKQLV